ncbi:MAG TPA: Ig-like domain-containing protein [Gemmatimonadales bacterium]|nr:Ig-like domain-containing protein [Gemmatimonadales bacterium]
MARVRKVEWDSRIKLLATILSGGAALVSILSFVAGRRTAHASDSAAGLEVVEVTRIALSPLADTAHSLGDTLHFATVAADAHGQVLHAASVHWTVDNPTIAHVDSAGQVVALAPGVTTVMVAIGGRTGRARVVVQPRMTELTIIGDSVIPIAEGTTLELRAMGADARGNWLDPVDAVWSGGDAEVALIDTAGTLQGIAPGLTTISVAAAGLAAERKILVTPVPASLTLTAGADQRAAASQKLPGAVAVQVVSRSGRPVPGVHVTFDPSASGGQVEPPYVTTDSLGVAATRWTLGPTAGRQRLAVEVAGIDSAMLVTAEADPTPGNTVIVAQPDSLMAEVGTVIADAVAVQVTDTSGMVLADVPVTWTALDGGSFSQASARTDSVGMAQAHWQVGPKAGRQRARVQVGNPRTIPPVELFAYATPGPATALRLVSGDEQRGVVSLTLARAIVVRALDSLGNGVGGVPIRFASHSGEIDSVIRTDSTGRAGARWTLGKMAGEVRAVARMEGTRDSVVTTATARPGRARSIAFVAAPAGGTAGKPLSKSVRMVVRDQFGNAVPNVTVRFTVSGGSVNPRSGVSDASGTVWTKWTLGTRAGSQVLTASVVSPAVKATHTLKASAPPAPKTPVSTKRRTSKK